MSAWQPIDTCPKDGSFFRAWVVVGTRVATENEHSFQIEPVFTKAFPLKARWRDVSGLHFGFVDYELEEMHEVEDVLFWQPLETPFTPPEGFLL